MVNAKRTAATLLFTAAGLVAARAGMTVYELTDIVRLRLEDISFFGFLLVLATLGVWALWNFFARDFPGLPRLNLARAFCLTALLGMAMLLVLTMISGARELLTPGAWQRQGSHYRPNDLGNPELRQQSIESLRTALLQYAHSHEGHFPPHDYVPDIPPKVWQAPDSTGSRYIYVGGLALSQTNALLACEPAHFGDERLVLFAGGRIQKLRTPQIQDALRGRR